MSQSCPAIIASIEPFRHDLDEIVQMDGVGLITLRSALRRMPDRVGPLGALSRQSKDLHFSMPRRFRRGSRGTGKNPWAIA
jgi:hypothetical protein